MENINIAARISQNFELNKCLLLHYSKCRIQILNLRTFTINVTVETMVMVQEDSQGMYIEESLKCVGLTS